MKTIYILLGLFLVTSCKIKSQAVYRTPSGSKYHLASCRMVENVSSKVVNPKNTRLNPCKICNPPSRHQINTNLKSKDKSVGESKSTQCKGTAKSTGNRCKHMTRLANGYCFQHKAQKKSIKKKNQASITNNDASTRCGAETRSGKRCKRKVKGGGRCHQHWRP